MERNYCDQKDLNRFETVNHNAGTDPHLIDYLNELMSKQDVIYRQINL